MSPEVVVAGMAAQASAAAAAGTTETSPVFDTVLCVLSSAMAGMGAAFFGCILSWADHRKRDNGGVHTKASRRVAIFGAVGSTIFGFSSLVGLYFGPVTLVVVIRAGSLMPANALFSQLFGLRPLTRDDYLGTVVTISGVLCFSIFGGSPAAAPSPDEFVAMVQTLSASICNVVLLVVFALSLGLLTRGHDDQMPIALAVTNLGGISSAFMDLAAKGWSAALNEGIDHAWSSPLFWSSLGLNVLFLVCMRASMIYGCKRCDVLLFVPLNTVLNIFYSVVAGMVVLQEWKQVISWTGLLSASTSVLGGVVMLVTGPAKHDGDHDASPPAVADHSWASEDQEAHPLTSGSDIVRRRKSSRRRFSDAVLEHTRLISESEGSPRRRSGAGSFDWAASPKPTPLLSPASDVSAGPRRAPAASSTSELRPQGSRTPESDGRESKRVSDASDARPAPSMSRSSTGPTNAVQAQYVPNVSDLVSAARHGLRPEIIAMNSLHFQAFRVRARWSDLKTRLRDIVHLDALRRGNSAPRMDAETSETADDSDDDSRDSDSERSSDGCVC